MNVYNVLRILWLDSEVFLLIKTSLWPQLDLRRKKGTCGVLQSYLTLSALRQAEDMKGLFYPRRRREETYVGAKWLSKQLMNTQKKGTNTNIQQSRFFRARVTFLLTGSLPPPARHMCTRRGVSGCSGGVETAHNATESLRRGHEGNTLTKSGSSWEIIAEISCF